MRRIARAGLILLVAGSAFAAGCQRREQAAPPPRSVTATPGADGVQAVTVAEAGAGQFRFVPDTVTAGVGRIRITFRNTGNTPHNLTFADLLDAGKRVAVPTLRGGAEGSIEFSVGTPGQYRFVCTIHEALGQTGTLNVRR
jgi:plastocyanin